MDILAQPGDGPLQSIALLLLVLAPTEHVRYFGGVHRPVLVEDVNQEGKVLRPELLGLIDALAHEPDATERG
jgi:hypothetical protein